MKKVLTLLVIVLMLGVLAPVSASDVDNSQALPAQEECITLPPWAVVGDLKFPTVIYWSTDPLEPVRQSNGREFILVPGEFEDMPDPDAGNKAFWVWGVDAATEMFYAVSLGCSAFYVPMENMDVLYELEDQDPEKGVWNDVPLPTIYDWTINGF